MGSAVVFFCWLQLCVCGRSGSAGGDWPCWGRYLHPMFRQLDHRKHLRAFQLVLLQRKLLQRKDPHSVSQGDSCQRADGEIQSAGRQRRRSLQGEHYEAEDGRHGPILLWSGQNCHCAVPGSQSTCPK